MQIGSGIHRVGDRSLVNAYLIAEANKVTLVDAGIAGLYRDLPKSSRRGPNDRGRARPGIDPRPQRPRRLPRAAPHRATRPGIGPRGRRGARWGEVPNPSKGLGPTKAGPVLGFLWFSLVRGGLRTRHLGEVSTFGDGATLDVPGSPVVTLTPGHTPGSAVLHFRSLGALLIGDAFATYAVTTGARGPGVAPFTADAAQAVESLARIQDMSSDLVLPGHGDPWTGGVEEAVRLVRESAAPNVQG